MIKFNITKPERNSRYVYMANIYCPHTNKLNIIKIDESHDLLKVKNHFVNQTDVFRFGGFVLEKSNSIKSFEEYLECLEIY